MTERYTLSYSEIEDIRKMPDWVGELAQKYPVEIVNASEVWEREKFPRNYIPETIEIFYGNPERPQIVVFGNEVVTFLVTPPEIKTITVFIDSYCAYVEVEGKEIVNKLGGVILPEVIVEPSRLISIAIKGELND